MYTTKKSVNCQSFIIYPLAKHKHKCVDITESLPRFQFEKKMVLNLLKIYLICIKNNSASRIIIWIMPAMTGGANKDQHSDLLLIQQVAK